MKNNNQNVNITNKSSYKAGWTAALAASAISLLFLTIVTGLSIVPDFNYLLIQGSIFGLASTVVSAVIIYFITGILVWGSLYAFMDPYMDDGYMSKGIKFGILIWILVMVILMPLSHAGFFLSQYGFIAALVVLVTDLIFGILTAYFYARLRK